MATVTKIISRGSKNRLLQTEDFTSGATNPWSASGTGSRTTTVGNNPVGTNDNNLDLLEDTAGGGTIYKVFRTVSTTDHTLANLQPWSNNIVTFSVYLKPNTTTASRIVLAHTTGSAPSEVRFTITWATATTETTTETFAANNPIYHNSDLRQLANGWYRASVSIRYTVGGVSAGPMQCEIHPANSGSGAALSGSVWAWGAQFEEGPYATSYVAIPAADPIVPDYATILAWKTATDNTLTVGTDVNIGYLQNEDYYVSADTLIFNNPGNGSSTNHRRISGAVPYDPITNTGPRVMLSFASTGTSYGFNIQENRVTLDNFGIFGDFHNRPTSGINYFIKIDSANRCRIWDMFISSPTNKTTSQIAISITGTDVFNKAVLNNIFNTIIRGGGEGSTSGFSVGVEWNQHTEIGGIYNSVIYGIRGGNGYGLFNVLDQSIPDHFPSVYNCILVENKVSMVGRFLASRNNISSDYLAIAEGLEIRQDGAERITITSFGTPPTGGTWNMTVNGQTTAPIAFDAGVSTVRTRLEDLSTVNVGQVEVIATTGGTLNNANQIYTLSFLFGTTEPPNGPNPAITASFGSLTGGTLSFGILVQGYASEPEINLADPLSKGGIAKDTLWLNAEANDFRLKPGSPAIDAGVSKHSDFLAVTGPGVSYDFIGTAREGGSRVWDIGPYEGAANPISTEFNRSSRTVGKDKSRDYGSLGQYLAYLPRSLYLFNRAHEAVCYPDGTDNIATTLQLPYYATSTTPSNNIEIRAASFIKPKSRAGHVIKLNMDIDTGSRHRAVLWNSCRYVSISGIMFHQAATTATAKNCRVIELFADDCTLDSLFCLFDGNLSRTIGYCIDVESSRTNITNCLVRGSNTPGTGPSAGINLTDNCDQIQILHCVAYRIKGGTTAQFNQAAVGIHLRTGLTNSRISGCIAMETAGSGVSAFDFVFGAGLSADGVQDRCISGDATAVGSKSFNSSSPVPPTAANVFNNAPIDDFRLKAGSMAINAGANFAETFGFDIEENPRTAPYDIGVYEGVAYAPLLVTPAPKDAHRFCTLWEIVRTDGVGHYFCSLNESITHAGQLYKPSGQTTTSARRLEGALKEHNVEVLGAITSDEIEANDLAAGLFTGAVVTERIIDWRYPWTTPYRMRKYRVASLDYDQDSWRAELGGHTLIMDQKIGEVIGIDCPYVLGGTECQLKLITITQVNKTVSSISDVRREFISSGLSGTGVTTDDYFGKGKLTWISGANAGLVMEVKKYIGASKTIRLTFKTPYDITTSDRFNLAPGCRKRLVADCITKFNNGINFGGRAHIPGTDKAFDTPAR